MVFFFKLREAGVVERRSSVQEEEGRIEGEVKEGAWDLGEEGEAEDTFLRELGDIRHNPEEGCRVLQVRRQVWAP